MSRVDDLRQKLAMGGVEFKLLGDITEMVRGNGMPKTDLIDAGVGAIHYGQIYTRFGAWTETTVSFVAPEVATKLARVEPGNVIITNTSENLEDVGKAVAWLGKETIVTGGHATVLRHNEDPKYLSYWFQSESFFAQKKALATGTKVIDVSARQLAKVRIPIPPIELQREIASTLDELCFLETELSTQLQAELELRRGQCTYYMARLLTFAREGRIQWATLPDVSVNCDSQRRPITKSARETGIIPYYGASGVVDHVADYIFDGDYLLVSEDGANLLARSTPIAFSISGKTWVNNHAHVLQCRSSVERQFLEYYLNSINLQPYVSAGPQQKLSQANFNKIPVTVLSEAEQSRLVSALDELTQAHEDLSANLSAELDGRRKQYEYYRDKLLAFEEAVA